MLYLTVPRRNLHGAQRKDSTSLSHFFPWRGAAKASIQATQYCSLLELTSVVLHPTCCRAGRKLQRSPRSMERRVFFCFFLSLFLPAYSPSYFIFIFILIISTTPTSLRRGRAPCSSQFSPQKGRWKKRASDPSVVGHSRGFMTIKKGRGKGRRFVDGMRVHR